MNVGRAISSFSLQTIFLCCFLIVYISFLQTGYVIVKPEVWLCQHALAYHIVFSPGFVTLWHSARSPESTLLDTTPWSEKTFLLNVHWAPEDPCFVLLWDLGLLFVDGSEELSHIKSLEVSGLIELRIGFWFLFYSAFVIFYIYWI